MSKYKAIAQLYKGVRYASKGEAFYAMELDLRKKAGEIAAIEPQFSLRLMVNGQLICRYVADFLVTMPDGSQEIHEYKGYATDVFRLKWKLAQALFGDKYSFVLIQHTR